MLAAYRSLPTSFVRDIILKAPSQDMMNTLARSVLTLYTYDDRADDISLPNVLRQCLQLIALFPMLSVYGYQAYSHYHDGKNVKYKTSNKKVVKISSTGKMKAVKKSKKKVKVTASFGKQKITFKVKTK